MSNDYLFILSETAILHDKMTEKKRDNKEKVQVRNSIGKIRIIEVNGKKEHYLPFFDCTLESLRRRGLDPFRDDIIMCGVGSSSIPTLIRRK